MGEDGCRGVDDGVEEGQLGSGCYGGWGHLTGHEGRPLSRGRVRDPLFDDDRSSGSRAGPVVVVVVVVIQVARHLVDEGDDGVVGRLRAAHPRYEQTLEADGLAELVQLEQKSRTVAQVSALTPPAFRRRAGSRSRGRGGFRAVRARVQTVADLLRRSTAGRSDHSRLSGSCR